ncbi:DUF1345 domain-containing protein [Frigoribacterium sp. MCBA15_019]|uniref:DUF1345 domain-containing protein n=1 Tax=Frigoribacterium sp. MCBA15_019 TaxID=1898745 RepID=UPI0009F679D7|nr:DUF1345 domain-containing protein [Frigoribacterium sp. MCBA15_019]
MSPRVDAEATAVRMRRSRLRFVVMAVVGVAGAAGTWPWVLPSVALAIGWAAACVVYLAWVWLAVGRLDADDTRRWATREDPSRPAGDLLLVIASVASLLAVGVVLVRATSMGGAVEDLLAGLAVVSIALSWFLVHTLFTLRYAVLYYSGDEVGGISFNQPEPPRYADFAYVAFGLGMTFQIADTDIGSSVIRAVVLRHMLLSYLFGSVILASTVNLIAGLGG